MMSNQNQNQINEERKKKKQNWKKWKEEKLLKKMLKAKMKDEVKIEPPSDPKSNEDDSPKEVSTLSIAIPGSIIANAQTLEQKTDLAGSIARCANRYCVDEVIVYDDMADSNYQENVKEDNISARHYCLLMAKIIQYLECPYYLRKHFFPSHPDLKFVAKLPSLNAPHHLRADEDFPFREGIIVKRPPEKGSLVNVGLSKDIIVDKVLPPWLRVTVKLIPPKEGSKKMRGIIVAPTTPKLETSTYWGYTVRIAPNLSSVFNQCPYSGGYDLTIGTSDKGTNIKQLDQKTIPPYKHALIAFGGLSGLEAALENDPVLTEQDPAHLFKFYLNTCSNQGTRTIRTEEAIFISLQVLKSKLVPT